MDYILYLRASTLRQGQSGLEGQRLIAHPFLQPGDRIVSEYIFTLPLVFRDCTPAITRAISRG
jgi:hypothetical protein